MLNRKIVHFFFREVGMANPELWVLCDDGTMWMKPAYVTFPATDMESALDKRNWKRVHLPIDLFTQGITW